MSDCNKCNGTLFVCENHPDQEAHQCKHCGGAGMLCECTKISEPIGNTKQLPIRWMHINGTVIKVENPDDFDMRFFIPLYTHPMRKLSDEEILEKAINIFGVQRFEMLDDIYWTSFAKAIIKASRGEK